MQSPMDYHRERHQNQFPTQEIRQRYAQQMADAMEQAARAFAETAKRLREEPDVMVAQAFQPNIYGMHRQALAEIRAHYFQKDDKPAMDITGHARIDPSAPLREVGIRLIWVEDEGVFPREDLVRG